jgi:hypothetical protein
VRAAAVIRGLNTDASTMTAAIRTHAHVNAIMGKLQVSRERATVFAQQALRMFAILQRRLGPPPAGVPAAELRLLGAESLVYYAGCHEVVASFDNDDPSVYQQAISALQVRDSTFRTRRRPRIGTQGGVTTAWPHAATLRVLTASAPLPHLPYLACLRLHRAGAAAMVGAAAA